MARSLLLHLGGRGCLAVALPASGLPPGRLGVPGRGRARAGGSDLHWRAVFGTLVRFEKGIDVRAFRFHTYTRLCENGFKMKELRKLF